MKRTSLLLGTIACLILLASAQPVPAAHSQHIQLWIPPTWEGDPETPDLTLAIRAEGSLEESAGRSSSDRPRAGEAEFPTPRAEGRGSAHGFLRAWFMIWRLSWTLR